MSSLKVFAYLLIAGDARKLCILEKVDNTVAHCIGGWGERVVVVFGCLAQ